MLLSILKIVGALVVALMVLVGCQTYRNSGQQTPAERAADALRLGTYNVHYIIVPRETGPWSMGDWERRKVPLDLAFKALDADLVGFQEMESFNWNNRDTPNFALEWLLSQNPDYAAAAVGDPREFPSTQPILFRKDRLSVLDQGWFFFSTTPDEIYSRTFNGSYPAFASWAMFEDQRTGNVFRVLNMHTDFSSRSNRLQSAALVAERITPWIDAGETVFVIGDMNARLGDQTLRLIEEPGIRFAPVRGATVHFNRGLNLFAAIDHIGVAGQAELVSPPVVIREKFAGEWPTDHYPVIADYTLSAP